MRVFVDCQGCSLYVKTDEPQKAGPLLRRLMTVRGLLPTGAGEWQLPLLPKSFEAILSGIEAVAGEMVLVPGMTRRVSEWLSKREESVRPASSLPRKAPESMTSVGGNGEAQPAGPQVSSAPDHQ